MDWTNYAGEIPAPHDNGSEPEDDILGEFAGIDANQSQETNDSLGSLADASQWVAAAEARRADRQEGQEGVTWEGVPGFKEVANEDDSKSRTERGESWVSEERSLPEEKPPRSEEEMSKEEVTQLEEKLRWEDLPAGFETIEVVGDGMDRRVLDVAISRDELEDDYRVISAIRTKDEAERTADREIMTEWAEQASELRTRGMSKILLKSEVSR